MGRGEFSFKRFTVRQERCAMKVGTDGVLLGAWAQVSHSPRRILDIGAGTGVIALMMAQRTEPWGGEVHAVEIDHDSAAQAAENAEASPWPDRVEVTCDSLQHFAACGQPGIYDLIVSNPPYFDSSLLPPDERRMRARHNGGLPFDDLARCAARLLAAEGIMAVILPPAEAAMFLSVAAVCGLRVARTTEVYSLPDSPPKRLLIELVHEDSWRRHATDTLTIETSERGVYTEEYRALTRDFYLKF